MSAAATVATLIVRQQPGGLSAADRLAGRSRRRPGGDRRREPGQLRALPGRRAGRRRLRGRCRCRPGAPIASATAEARARPTRRRALDRQRRAHQARAISAPPQEPELVRALGMLELQRRRFVRDRTQAIQRLRSDWTQHDPVAEAGVLRCDRQQRAAPPQAHRSRRQPRPAHRRALHPRARRATSTTSTTASPRWTREIADLLAEHGNPLADLHGVGTNLAAAIIAQAGDVRRFRNAAAFARFCGAAPDPLRLRTNRRPPPPAPRRQPPTQRRALPHRDRPTTPPPRKPKPSSPARSPKARPHAKPAAPSNATSPTSSTAASRLGQHHPRT